MTRGNVNQCSNTFHNCSLEKSFFLIMLEKLQRLLKYKWKKNLMFCPIENLCLGRYCKIQEYIIDSDKH